jgi:hypothetical protein
MTRRRRHARCASGCIRGGQRDGRHAGPSEASALAQAVYPATSTRPASAACIQRGGVQRQVVEGLSGRVGFVDGKIVVVNAGLRWAGDRFVRLTDAEKSDAIERVSMTNESGRVFRRGLLSAFETDVTISLNGDAYRLRAKPKGRLNSLTVSRNGGQVETVVSVDGKVRFVSRATYEELFHDSRLWSSSDIRNVPALCPRTLRGNLSARSVSEIPLMHVWPQASPWM